MKVKIKRYAFRYWYIYIISLTGLAVGVYLSTLGPKLTGMIVDQVMGEGKHELFWRLAIPMALTYVLSGIFHYMEEFSADIISKRVERDLSLDLFDNIQSQDGQFFRERTPADLMSRTTEDCNYIGFSFGFCGIFFLECVAYMVSMSIAILSVNPLGAIVPFILMPIIAFLGIRSEIIGDKISDEISDITADLNQCASEAITGIRTVKSFGKEEHEKAKLRVHSKAFRDKHRKLDLVWADWGTPMTALGRMMLILSTFVSGLLVIGGTMTLGEFTEIFQYTNQLTWPVLEFGWLLSVFAQSRASARKVRAIFGRETLISDGEHRQDTRRGTMEFNSVSLSFGDKKVLDDISFKITPGKTVAIMGATGSGKSLIANLAMRFIDPTEGGITINGKDIKSVSIEDARMFSSIVTQDVFLFSDSVTDNIKLGQRDKELDDEVRKASQDAKAEEFIINLQEGYDTVIGERGVGLSGGQKQRLSIARAFLKKSQLLILDDATSALDMETERDIERTIRKEKDKSLLIIAHRVSAVAFADEILILEDGRIEERGTHEELMKRKGLYYKTYISQYPEESDEREL